MDSRQFCIAAVIGSALVLSGCGGGGNGAAGQPISDTKTIEAQPSFAFVARPKLVGLAGTIAIAYGSPPAQIGTINDGKGNLSVLDYNTMGISPIFVWPRVPYDIRVADFNGDGIPDIISDVYSPTNVESQAMLFFGNGDNTYRQDTSFGAQYTGTDYVTGYRGRTETIVVADFNNDGAVDIFLPTYTYLDSVHDLAQEPGTYDLPGPPPNVHNAKQSFLLLNDGTGKFTEHAVDAGVSMHSSLAGLSATTTDPNGMQPEGVQAVDFNMDGLIDLFVGGHLFINQGVDAQGIPHFKDMAESLGLTRTLLRAAPPWAPDAANVIPDYADVVDEGAKFIDWNNDGHLDLLLFRWNWGPAHGTRLFEFDGTTFTERTQALTSATASCSKPVTGNVAIFATNRPTTLAGDSAGINAYDLDNSGFEDVLVSGDSKGPVVFKNNGCGFSEATAGDLAGKAGGSGAMALADWDNDGVIDVIYPTPSGVYYYLNQTPPNGSSFTVEVLGSQGEHNQYGRVVQVFPPGTSQIYTRVVDGGSGYLSQNQYPLLIGTPFPGKHTVKVYYAPLTPCIYGGPACKPAVLSFTISPGQHAMTYAPTAANPSGSVTIH
ncbi:MAG: VCBS repeat-containing protein [Proteobacteria bacterium]|nr:VCBS repeat-containing protein [Pseudomonadota bacterium]